MISSDVIRGSDLVFYPEPHEYFTPPGREGGRLIPNVTRVLQATGVSADFAAVERVNPGTMEFRRSLGSAVHIDCHAYDDADLDWATVDDRVRPYLDAWATFRDNYAAVPLLRERRVYHPTLGCCGTFDGIFELQGGAKRVLVDLKIGDPDDAAAHLQTAFYESAYLTETGALIDERWSVRLDPDRAVPYVVTNYTARPHAWRDIQIFQAVLVTYHEQAVRRRPVR